MQSSEIKQIMEKMLVKLQQKMDYAMEFSPKLRKQKTN